VKFKRKPIDVEAVRILRVQEVLQPDGKKVIAKPGDWLVNNHWIYRDKFFRKYFVPVDKEGEDALKVFPWVFFKKIEPFMKSKTAKMCLVISIIVFTLVVWIWGSGIAVGQVVSQGYEGHLGPGGRPDPKGDGDYEVSDEDEAVLDDDGDPVPQTESTITIHTVSMAPILINNSDTYADVYAYEGGQLYFVGSIVSSDPGASLAVIGRDGGQSKVLKTGSTYDGYTLTSIKYEYIVVCQQGKCYKIRAGSFLDDKDYEL